MRTMTYNIPAAAFGANYATPGLTVEHLEGYSAVVSTLSSSTVVGTVKLQASNNALIDNVGVSQSYPDPNAVWVDVPGSTQNVTSGANTIMWNTSLVYYHWFRIVFTYTSGAGTAAIYVHAKGAQS